MRDNIPKWLKDLQENSWELEILISGGAIFTLFQVSDIWINWLENLNIISILPGTALFLLLGTLGLETLKLGFILHLALRAYWLSMVCINYVFPSGIQKNKISWKKPYKINFDENEDLRSPIIQVDKVCGIVMYLSIISTFLLAGIIFSIFITVSLPMIFDLDTGIVGSILLFAFIVYISDLLLGGLFRRIAYLSYLTYPFFVFYDYLTFRKFHQKPALLFFTNIPKWKFAIISSAFFLVALTFSYLTTYKIMHWPYIFDDREYRWQMTNNVDVEVDSYYYKDEISGDKFPSYCIQSKIIKGNYLELFVQYKKRYDELVKLLPAEKNEAILSDIFKIQINDSVYSNIEWFELNNHSAVKLGIMAMINIEHLEDGKNILKIGCSDFVYQAELEGTDPEHDRFRICYERQIPFWKDSSN
jgi:hypothetical protein